MKYKVSENYYTKSYDKYAVFNHGDEYSPSETLFKGIKFKLKQVENIYTDENGKIEKILYGDKNYNDYKFSIIFNENYNGVNSGLINSEGYVKTNSNLVNIILNEKHQNILVIINSMLGTDSNLNDISLYDVKEGLYYGKSLAGNRIPNYNPEIFVASNFINAINDYINGYNLEIRYYYIKENPEGFMTSGEYVLSTGSGNPPSLTGSTMNNIPDWPYLFTPFMLSAELPIEMMIYNNCYTTYPFYVDSVYDDYVATLINFDDSKSKKTTIYRFNGPYEPIFKDINVFKSGFFCYNDIIIQTEQLQGSGIYSPTKASDIPNLSNIEEVRWENFESIGGTTDRPLQASVPPNFPHEIVTRELSITGFDFANVPVDAEIKEVHLLITRRTLRNEGDLFYVKDKGIFLSKNCFITLTGSTGLRSENVSIENRWTREYETIKYGESIDDFWRLPLTGADILNPNFGVNIQVTVRNAKADYVYLPQISDITLIIEYLYTGITYEAQSALYFDNNYKFDTDLNDFGKIDEIIYSKVNEKVNPLRDTREIFHIYPTIDNFGYGVTDRFVFKSSWDKEYFIRTEPRLRDISGNV